MSRLLLSILFGAAHFSLQAQNVLVNPGNGSYATLQAAFTAISAGTHSGIVTVQIVGNTTETGSCVLNQLAAGTTISIQPVGQRTVTGSISGAALIDLNGVDNLTINGLKTGGNSLTFVNTSTSSTANTSTLMIRNDAKNITVRNCTLLGSSQVSGPTVGGTVFIGNTLSVSFATGNDNLLLEDNDIGPAGTNYPAKAIFANGDASTLSSFQERVTINRNRIYDFFNATGQSHGVYHVAVAKAEWLVSNNHFYQTTPKTHTASSATQTVIQMGTGSGTATGSVRIENNTIGYATANKTGVYQILSPGVATRWYGIRVDGERTLVRYNIITALSFDGAASGTGQTNPLSCIYAGSGARIFDNQIGDTAFAAAISYSSSATATSWVYGIWASAAAAGRMQVEGNTIAGFRLSSTNSNNSQTFHGIYVNALGADTNYIRNNLVGHPTGPIENNTQGTSGRILGIWSQQANCKVENNHVQYLVAQCNNAGSTTGNVINGIEVSSSAGTITNSSMNMTGNTIHHLIHTHPTTAGWIKGIEFRGPAGGNHTIVGNFIHNLLIPNSTSATATVAGIHTNHSVSSTLKGNTMVANNMIALGTALTTNSIRVFGTFEVTSGNNMQYYHNSVFIGGAVASGNQSESRCISSGTDRTFLNNVLMNIRTNTSGSSKHYALVLNSASISPSLVSNRNVLFSSGVLLRAVITEYNTLSAWQAASGKDANSVSANPQFANPTAATPDLHLSTSITSPAENIGQPIPAVLFDFDGEPRSGTTPDAGADEKAGGLPVVWGPLQVSRQGAASLVQWTTLTEVNVRNYEVERSFDAQRFNKIGTVASLAPGGNSTQPITYRYIDNEQHSREVFYRIRQTDLDGKTSVSKVVRLPATTVVAGWRLLSNPVKGQLLLEATPSVTGTATIYIMNAGGQVLKQEAIKLNAGAQMLRMDVQALKPGMYSVVICPDDHQAQKQVLRFLKE